jgi:hypothetical protein
MFTSNQRINGQWSKISDQSHPSSLRHVLSRNPEILGGWAGFVYPSNPTINSFDVIE